MSDPSQTRGTFVLAWSDTRIDGLDGAPESALVPGAEWVFDGPAVRVDGATDILTLTDPIGGRDLRRRAGRIAYRMLRRAEVHVDASEPAEVEETAVGDAFTLTDGRSIWSAALLRLPEAARPLILFTGAPPPIRTPLTVVSAPSPGRHTAPAARTICFAAGTWITTTRGPVPVDLLRVGDEVLTRDDGPQPILWIGQREVSGARLHVQPDLRPVRVPKGAFAEERPEMDLLVSPLHRLLVRGQAARALFNEPEVLVAAADLVGRSGIHIDRRITRVAYLHVMLPRHAVLWAGGVAAESFHPADTDITALPPSQSEALLRAMPALAEDTTQYGPPARRVLSRAEAQLLVHDGTGRRALRRAG